MKTLDNKVVYLIMTGAKKCSIMPGLIREFLGEGARVYTFLTDMARKIANIKDFEISGNEISLDYSKNGEEIPLEDIVIVAPATFNTINKAAQGIADSYPLTIVASAIGKKKRVIFAPAMNRSLWEHPIIPRSIDTLQQWGCQVIWPEITPEKITMAPLEKIADTAYNCFSKIRYESEQLPSNEIYQKLVEEYFPEFRFVGESLLEKDLVKGSAGFMSRKVNGGILISATGSNVGSLTKKDISLVTGLENGRVGWIGEKHPSSETPMILEVYKAFPETGAMIHTHGRKLTYSLAMGKYASTEYVRYGRFGELSKILSLLKTNNGFAIMKLHGELCIGENLYNAYRKLEDKLKEDI
ncbi:MAG TPA: flavoprotein [Candidatus Omnitrophota bacterium]|nr:flavoprotein [Candidatus Omnitrophota bacterium]